MNKSLPIVILLFSVLLSRGQSNIGNYVSNGGFEQIIPGSNPIIANSWSSTDSSNSFFGEILSAVFPPYNVPLSGYTYQWPRHGNNYLIGTFFCSTCTYNIRGYPKNRLKANLQAGKTYCVSFYVNLTNKSSYAISSFGVYFGDGSIDTIKYCTIPLTYLTPQIQNPLGNFLSDTLNWVQIKGLYTATGTEKYMLLGNFKNDGNSDTIFVSSEILPQRGCSYLLEDVSCIEVDLPADAGRDTTILPGSWVFLGRESDFATDPGCFWYQWPDLVNALDTASGMWVAPALTTTYIVKQILDCSPEKWDTVVVTVDPTVGYSLFDYAQSDIRVFPNPTNGFIEFRSGTDLSQVFDRIAIYDDLGRLIREDGFKMKIKTEDLSEGIYSLQLYGASGTISKRVVIAR